MQTRIYKAGSVVYFAGDKADRIYILKQGQAQIVFISVETGVEARELVNVGEFLGVKSALGLYPQEETAQCLSDCSIIIFTYEEFEALVSKNTSVILKMLRVFSNQLRKINKKVRALVDTTDVDGPEQTEGLFATAEFYFKNKKFKQALYAYRQYIKCADESSVFFNTAKEKITACKENLGIDEAEELANPRPKAASSSKQDPDSSNSTQYGAAKQSYENGDYTTAIKHFNALKSHSDVGIAESATFYMGKCYYMLQKYDNALSTILATIQKYPRSSDVKEAILFLAKACNAKGDVAKAKAYYQKVVSMQPECALSSEARTLLDKL